MSFESTQIRFITQVIHALAGTDKDVSLAHAKRDGKRKHHHEHDAEEAHPVHNTQGEVTGKLIDTTA